MLKILKNKRKEQKFISDLLEENGEVFILILLRNFERDEKYEICQKIKDVMKRFGYDSEINHNRISEMINEARAKESCTCLTCTTLWEIKLTLNLSRAAFELEKLT